MFVVISLFKTVLSYSVFAAISDASPTAFTDSPAAGSGITEGSVPISQHQTR